MKKHIALFCGALMFSNVCWGVTLSCSGGTAVTAQNGTRLCRSDKALSWYASHGWCAKNGGKLATQDTACLGQNKCNNIKNIGTATCVWGFINKRSGTTVYRVKLATSANIGSTQLLNRPVGSATTGETSTKYGAITDMCALCEPLNSTDTY